MSLIPMPERLDVSREEFLRGMATRTCPKCGVPAKFSTDESKYTLNGAKWDYVIVWGFLDCETGKHFASEIMNPARSATG